MSPHQVEDGYRLWLRNKPLPAGIPFQATGIRAGEPRLELAARELASALSEMLGRPIPTTEDGSIQLKVSQGLAREEYRIDFTSGGLEIEGGSPIGVLYGVFGLLRALQTGQRLPLADRPRLRIRMLNHWDDLDGFVERGYAGRSIFDWHRLPEYVDNRLTDYARACASIGINGAAITNVNANAIVLRSDYLEKAAAVADVLRPYGVITYLTARFSAPIELGGLPTADPLDPRVNAWWTAKVEEIYEHIPDFGGFVVKANSEGQPGPQDYGRSHVDGANILAAALEPHGGVVVWRAFVYSDQPGKDRAMQSYDEFLPLDGQFADNVLLQIKNGPIDFQPREPYHPLFGALQQTNPIMEVQITKEYLGFSTWIASLAEGWREVLDSPCSDSQTVESWLTEQGLSGMAGVANIGSDRNWCGSHFDQFNWYAFGRLAWDPCLASDVVAREWAVLTWGKDAADKIVEILRRSYQATVNSMSPLGLVHLMGTSHHYGPAPWVDDLGREDWNPTYFHRADTDGIGFDRTESGSNALQQYPPEARSKFEDPRDPEALPLYFSHLPWQFAFTSGRNLWEELVARYDSGVAETGAIQSIWEGLQDNIDPRRYRETAALLTAQVKEARWWRDACLAYYQSVSGLPWPNGTTPPASSLEEFKAMTFPYAPGNPGA